MRIEEVFSIRAGKFICSEARKNNGFGRRRRGRIKQAQDYRRFECANCYRERDEARRDLSTRWWLQMGTRLYTRQRNKKVRVEREIESLGGDVQPR